MTKHIEIKVPMEEYLRKNIGELKLIDNFEDIIEEINHNVRINYSFINETLELTFFNNEMKPYEDSYIRFPKVKCIILPLVLEHYLVKILLLKEKKEATHDLFIKNNTLYLKLKFRIE